MKRWFAVLRGNSRFYYRQAFEYSKHSSSFFIRKWAFLAAGFKKSSRGNEKSTFDADEMRTRGQK
jgi:hypothetical protein